MCDPNHDWAPKILQYYVKGAEISILDAAGIETQAFCTEDQCLTPEHQFPAINFVFKGRTTDFMYRSIVLCLTEYSFLVSLLCY